MARTAGFSQVVFELLPFWRGNFNILALAVR